MILHVIRKRDDTHWHKVSDAIWGPIQNYSENNNQKIMSLVLHLGMHVACNDKINQANWNKTFEQSDFFQLLENNNILKNL